MQIPVLGRHNLPPLDPHLSLQNTKNSEHDTRISVSGIPANNVLLQELDQWTGIKLLIPQSGEDFL